ncbi:MAG: permease-like cell division protein FtsX [Candidatus Microsaccharimonas sp.]
MAKKKVDSKTAAQQKRHHRKWVTFLRMCRYGVNNFTRNAWLTVAATAIMTITLFVIFVSLVSHTILTDTVDDLRDKVTMSIYLKTDATTEDVEKIAADVRGLTSVTAVAVVTPDQARDSFIEDNKDNSSTLDAIKLANNQFPWTLSIKVVDINDTSQLSNFVKDNELLKANISKDNEPSFAGQRRDAIESIGGAANLAIQGGIIVSVVFVSISMLIIFNTIRMAIFNRKEEIQMMKLIGAESSFIRGPFLVEAIVYGFFGAIIASALGYGLLMLVAPSLEAAKIPVQQTIDLLTVYAGFVVLGMIIAGAIIGVISSLLATRRYLKL